MYYCDCRLYRRPLVRGRNTYRRYSSVCPRSAASHTTRPDFFDYSINGSYAGRNLKCYS